MGTPGLAHAAPPPTQLPTTGQVVSGQATVGQSGAVMQIRQTSDRAVIDWQSFNVGAAATVNFIQPSTRSVVLNRVLDGNPSQIFGHISATGQVFLINPGGVIFGPTAQVDVGGIVASTLNLDNQDFMAGRYRFEGSSSKAIINQGHLNASGDQGKGGTIALIGARITNDGDLSAPQGNVLLGAGSKVTLDLGSPLKLQVDQGALDALIENGGAIRADGGQIYLSARATGELAGTVIHHTGLAQAQTLATGEKGEIYLLGGMQNNRIVLGGTLDASAPKGGDGGSIETSAAQVSLQDGHVVTTRASSGKTGNWLIDPNDYTIAASGGNITGAQLARDLASSNVTISTATQGSSGGNGDIHVNDAVSWSANKLTLHAERDINVNATLDASGSAALAFEYGETGRYNVATDARIYLSTPTAFTWKKGETGATHNLVLDNGHLRFGNGNEESLGADGQLKQPFYYDGAWYKLTFGARPLEIAVASGGEGGSAWNYNGQVLSTVAGTFFPALSNPRIDISGYREGYGTIVASSTLTFSTGQTARLENSYQLDATANYLKTTTQLTSLTGNALTNVRLWTGTGDDYVKNSDGPAKTKGNIVDGAFVQLSAQDQASNALRITESNDPNAAAVLFYSTTSGVDMVHDHCCSFNNVVNKNPQASPISAAGDGSYALFKRFPDLASGQSASMTWYYAAAPLTQLSAAVTQVSQAAAASASIPVYLRLNPGSSLYGETPQFTYSLFDASTNGQLVSNAIASGTVSWLGAPGAGSAAGTYSITYGGGITLGNTSYTLSAGSAIPWIVNPRPLGLTVSKTYDGNPAFTAGFILSGLVNGDAAPTVTGSASLNSRDVGSYTGFASSTLALSNSNYTLAGGSVEAAITPRPVTVSADAQSKTYGNADPALTYRVTAGNLVGSDTLSGALSRASGENVGRYSIDASQLHNPNYQVTAQDGTLTIDPRPVTVSADPQSKTYGNADPALTYRVTAGNLVGADTLSGALSRASGENVGRYSIDASQLRNPNYQVTAQEGTLTIDPRPVTVSADAQSKTYGNTDPALTYRVTAGNLVGSDTLSGALSRASGENVGRYSIDASQLRNPNYQITAQDGTLTIKPNPSNIPTTPATASPDTGNPRPSGQPDLQAPIADNTAAATTDSTASRTSPDSSGRALATSGTDKPSDNGTPGQPSSLNGSNPVGEAVSTAPTSSPTATTAPATTKNSTTSEPEGGSMASTTTTAATISTGMASVDSPSTSIDRLAESRIATALQSGMTHAAAEQAAQAFSGALVQQLSQGASMETALTRAEQAFQAEASLPAPRTAADAAARSFASGSQDVAKQLDALAQAQSPAGAAAFDQALSSALARGIGFDAAVAKARDAARQADSAARSNASPQAALAGGAMEANPVLGKTSTTFQRTLSALLGQGIPLAQAIDRARQADALVGTDAPADASRPATGLASGATAVLADRPADGVFDKALSAALARGEAVETALARALEIERAEQAALKAEARNPESAFARNGALLPNNGTEFDRALGNAMALGASPAQALLSANRAAAAPPPPQNAATALASGHGVERLLLSASQSRTFRTALSNALARGMPVERALALAKRAEAENAFRYTVPAAMMQKLTRQPGPLKISTADGQSLPSWLTFDPAQRQFVAAEIPDGVLPLKIRVLAGNRYLDLTISDQPGAR